MPAPRTRRRTLLTASAALGGALAIAAGGASAASAGTVAQVYFAPGTDNVTISNSVVRGDRDYYYLTAGAGQSMYTQIASLEANAVFSVYSPSGYLICAETYTCSTVLPEYGDYTVVVGGTRGNATYDLYTWIG